ncbi:type II toxin-antitoxin system HicA family toxin [Mycolicibacterium grossiae]|nr:type II toxin-antitoxin system HicA family toxin [Mycolicibacterium grossiae]
MAGVPKRLRPLWEAAKEAGWTYDETSDGHPRFTPPEGLEDPYRNRPAAPVTFGKTPSDHRGDKNATAVLRRLGVEVPHKGHTPRKEERS